MYSAIDVLSYSPTPDNPLKLVLLLVALVSLQPSPSLSARHPVTFPSATDIFLDRPLVLTPRYDYVVNLRREPGQKVGQRATLKVIVRAPNNRKAMAAAEALHPPTRQWMQSEDMPSANSHPAHEGTALSPGERCAIAPDAP